MSMMDWLVPGPVHVTALTAALAWIAHRPDGASRLRPWRRVLLAAAALSWAASTPALAEVGLRWLEGPVRPPPVVERSEHSLVVALGSGQMHSPGGRTNVRLDVHGWERVHGAVRLWRTSGGRLLVTGGPGRSEADSIAGAMSGLARELGVPGDAIVPVAGTRNTHEDLAAAAAIIQSATGPVWLVTSAIHMPRALAVARRLGLEVRAWPVDYRQLEALAWPSWLPDPQAAERLVPVLHEVVGRLAYRLSGRSE